MPTLLVKNIPEELMRELRKMKVELNCKTWVELLEKLVRFRRVILIERDEQEKMRRAVNEFLELREIVSKAWAEGTVLEEVRRARSHEAENFNS